MSKLQTAMDDLDDLKNYLYDCEASGDLSENINDQVQELLREARDLLGGEEEDNQAE